MRALQQVAQGVTDLDRTVAFYRDVLDGRLIARFDPPGLAFFDLDGVRLLLEMGALPCLLYFDVDDIHATRAQLIERGAEFVDEPHLIHRDDVGVFGPAGNETWMSFFKDSEGNVVALAEQKIV
jgi:methylmalonyl-CoA/ethylmalonyl-CoA epimerase